MRVADFLEGDGLRWSHDLLAQWLLPIDKDRVTIIRISPNKPGDVWYWVAEKDGLYSVRSAYRRLAGEAESVEVGGASDWEKEKWLWNRLWKIPVWPRVKLFFWQLCSEALATRANIATRIRVAKRVWEGLGLNEETGDSVGGVVFDGKEVDPWGVIRRVEDVMEEIEGGGFARPKDGAREGVKEGVGVSGGAVCRDERGTVLWGLSWVVEQEWEPQMAEAVAIYEGVQEALRNHHSHVVIESDCLSLVEALKKEAPGRSNLALVIADILTLCSSFISIQWVYTSRTNNSVAHALAHVLPFVAGRVVWSDSLPPTVNSAVSFDSLSMQ
ncbi:uncharacterized protein LOC141614282 [Silene latifolia]|uniref:uncharacterized protein LOC141614282 n=1 Tax=Silene latifolia TaxID=37657 RepID=UPI003D775012